MSSKGSGMNGIQPVSLRWVRGEEDEAVRSPVGCLFSLPRHYRQHCSLSWFVWHKISSICFTGSPRAVYQGALHNSIHALLAAGCRWKRNRKCVCWFYMLDCCVSFETTRRRPQLLFHSQSTNKKLIYLVVSLAFWFPHHHGLAVPLCYPQHSRTS